MIIVVATAMLGLSSRLAASEAAVNAWCPVMTEEEIDPEITTVYQGKTVAFCCDRCLAKFLNNPGKYVGNLASFTESSTSVASGGDESHQHDEAAGGEGEGREPWLGRVHPALVHFPLAGMPLALVGFLVWSATGREAFARADVPPLLVGTGASIAAVITGNIAHDAMRFSDTLHRIVEQHQFVATTVMVLAICLSVLRVWRWNRLVGAWRWAYGGGLAVACVLLGITGYLGGSLVFGPDHLKW